MARRTRPVTPQPESPADPSPSPPPAAPHAYLPATVEALRRHLSHNRRGIPARYIAEADLRDLIRQLGAGRLTEAVLVLLRDRGYLRAPAGEYQEEHVTDAGVEVRIRSADRLRGHLEITARCLEDGTEPATGGAPVAARPAVTVRRTFPLALSSPAERAAREMLAAARRIEAAVTESRTADTVPPAPAVGRKGRGKNIDARMLKQLADNLSSAGWSASQWADFLGCSAGTVKETKTWKERLKAARALLTVDAQMDRSQTNPKGRRRQKPPG